ncbi:hypothetical protein CPB83DRAFT_860447 [Crepidotus variabilis]|uniref:DUF6533 domain-containing protein n=1 Tax=Crepidotus variabilis TaxID=179855 RepID=A0A9P6E9F7_9AGAR|nr:hypothetical protein CPB83DRAFT_860447 [Crepidotus variabilis]
MVVALAELAGNITALLSSSSANVTPPSDWGMLEVLQAQNYSTLSALVVLLWDYFVTLQGECKYIWLQPCLPIQFAFILVRYYAVFSQIVNTVLIQTYDFPSSSTLNACRGWNVFLVGSFWVVYFGCEAVLMIRVHSSCNRSNKIGLWLLSHFAIEFAAATICTHQMARAWIASETCDGTYIPSTVVMAGLVIFFSQSILMLFTFVKRKFDKKGGRHVAFIAALSNDGGWPWMFYFCTAALLVPTVFLHKVAKPHILYTWPITVFSITGSRTVISISKAVTKAGLEGAPVLPLPVTQTPLSSQSTNPNSTLQTHSRTFDIETIRRDSVSHVRSTSPHDSFKLHTKKKVSSIFFASNPSINKPPVPAPSPRLSHAAFPHLEPIDHHSPSMVSFDSHQFDDNGLHHMPSMDFDAGENPYELVGGRRSRAVRIGIGSLQNGGSRETMDSVEWRDYWNDISD